MKDEASAYQHLRAMALGAAHLDLPTRSPGHPDIVGVVIDIPQEGQFATLAALRDGATSLYTSVGGGIIGGGEHDRVARANDRLLDEAQSKLPELRANDSTDHPSPGGVRIFVVASSGRHLADIPEDDFWTPGRGRLAELVDAAQNVITQLRSVSPQ